MEDDPFLSLIAHCKYTSSQYEKFRNCPFARESEVFPEDEPSPSPSSEAIKTPLEPTGILMVSLPGSSKDESTLHEEDDGCEDAERTVDLSKDFDNIRFLGPKLTPVTKVVEEIEVFESESKKSRESFSKKLTVSEENTGLETLNVRVGDNEAMMVETNRKENEGTEVFDSGFKKICEGLVGLVDWLTENTVNADVAVKETTEGVCENVSVNSATKNIEDIDKFKYVASTGVGRRKKGKGLGKKCGLPIWIRGQEKNVGGEKVSGASSAKNQLLKDLLDALKMVAEEIHDCSEHTDFLETAKRRGSSTLRVFGSGDCQLRLSLDGNCKSAGVSAGEAWRPPSGFLMIVGLLMVIAEGSWQFQVISIILLF